MKYVIAVGSAFRGFSFYGSFDTHEEAFKFGLDHLHTDTKFEICEIRPQAEITKAIETYKTWKEAIG